MMAMTSRFRGISRSAAAALAIVLSGAAHRVDAQTAAAAPVRMTVEDAIERGLATSHRIAEMAARRDAAEAVVSERHSAALPQVAAQAGYTRTNHVDPFGFVTGAGRLAIIYPDVPDNYRSRLDLQWPIYTAGRTDALERAARSEQQASTADIETSRADLRLEIVRSYWALVTANEAVRVVDESLRRMDAHLADIRNQFAAGLVPPNDVAAVQAQRSRQQVLTIQARATRDTAQADLARLTGLDPGTPIEPAATLAPPAAPAESADALAAEARERRPERAALVSRAAAAGDRTTAAKAGSRPTVGVGGGIDYARPNPKLFPRTDEFHSTWDASINANWTLFDGGRVKAETAEAVALRRAAEERLAEFDRVVEADVRERANELASALAAIDSANDAVTAAEESRRVVGDRFTAGVATSTEVLDAQVALLQAELDRANVIAAARLADARLARAVGR